MADDVHDPWVAPALERGDLGILATMGARSGATRRTHTGFARRGDGSLVVGAAHPSTQWPHNLAVHPRCRYAIRGTDASYDAVEVTGEARDAALRDLEAVYGENTPRGGRTFVLVPVAEGARSGSGSGSGAGASTGGGTGTDAETPA